MPELADPKIRPEVRVVRGEAPRHAYAELQVTSNFSFLRGGSHPEELVMRAAEAGCRAVALTDFQTMAGMVRAKMAAKEAGIKLVVGNRLEIKAATGVLAPPLPAGSPAISLSVLVYPTDRAAYGRLCRLLTRGKRRAAKGECVLTLEELVEHQEGLLAVLLSPPMPLMTEEFRAGAALLREVFDDDRLSVAATCLYDGRDRERLGEAAAFARGLRAPLVATNDVHYHVAERKVLQDVLTCIRLGCTLDQAGFALFANAERHIKGPDEMARLFRAYPGAIRRTVEIAERAAFSMAELKYEYPAEICPPGKSMMAHLTELTWQGARERYGGNDEARMTNDESNSNDECLKDRNRRVPEKVQERLRHEFDLIQKLNYPAYFLTIDDIVRFARSKGILCQGRGAAANSVVCYCLGITSVNPMEVELLVERFMSVERGEPPDIDIDFEHERREEVIQYIYTKYGRHRAALTAEVITYRRRSAIREVGKALGLSLDCIDRLAKAGDWWDKEVMPEDRLAALGLDPRDRTLRQAIEVAGELLGFPRHLSQHVGGFVISHHPLEEIVPIENAAMPDRTIIEWDKDDIDEMGMMKVDVLGLGMMTCIRKAIDLVNGWERSDEATKRRSDEGEGKRGRKGETGHGGMDNPSSFKESLRGQGADVPGSDRLAKGDGIGADHLSSDHADAGSREVRAYQPNASGGGFDSVEHRGRTRPAIAGGLSEIPEDCAGIAGRTDDAARIGDNTGNASAASERSESSGGRGSHPPRPDPQSREEGERKTEIAPPSRPPSVAPSLRRFVAPLQFHTVPREDSAVYDMLCKADSLGVFQVESRAQMTMLPRLKPRCYYDLVIEVAIVRPGPIQGDMVHPYLRRRQHPEDVEYPNDAVKEVLKRTLGVPLFQEQAMKLVMVAAGFSAGEADGLRRAMAAWKRKGHMIERYSHQILEGMAKNGYTPAYAQRVVNQIKGFADYGFPESHAASFAHLVYVSAWLKCHQPAAFAAALINSQPMGFYQPAQIIRDARDHDVCVLPIDVNHSGWDCRLQPDAVNSPRPALRLGMRLTTGLRQVEAERIAAAVQRHGRFATIHALWRAANVRIAALRQLAHADAFTSLGLDRQRALWQIMQLRDEQLPLLEGIEEDGILQEASGAVPLPAIPMQARVVHDYAATGLSLKAHPMSFVRGALDRQRVTRAGDLADERRHPHGSRVAVAGLVLVRQRPGTASGILFITLEDETGVANLVVHPNTYEQFRPALRHSVAILVRGKVERQGQVIHVFVQHAEGLTPHAVGVTAHSRDFH